MAVSVTPPVGEQNLVVVTVAAGVRLTVDVDERLGVAEVAGDAQRQMKGDWAIPLQPGATEKRLRSTKSSRGRPHGVPHGIVTNRSSIGSSIGGSTTGDSRARN